MYGKNFLWNERLTFMLHAHIFISKQPLGMKQPLPHFCYIYSRDHDVCSHLQSTVERNTVQSHFYYENARKRSWCGAKKMSNIRGGRAKQLLM